MNRRKFLQKTVQLGVVAGIPTGLYAWQFEPYWVEMVHHKMPFPHLDFFWKGRKIIQISDMHIGTRFNWEYMFPYFEKCKKMNPDLVVYTGDFINYSIEELNSLEEVLQKVPTGTLGTYAVLGNHDYGKKWSESHIAEAITQLLQKYGIQVLRNEVLTHKNLTIAGVDDFWGTNFEPELVTQKLVKYENTLLLIHNPDVIDLPIWEHFSGWMVSGHTHGGQVKPPFLPPLKLPVNNRRYTQGEFHIRENQKLYINRALGCSLPIRFNCRPEITVFQLS